MDRKHRGRSTVAVGAALLALPALAGCSGDAARGHDQGTAPTSVTVAAKPDPQLDWSERICAAVARTSVPLAPPRIDERDVAGTLRQLVTLFDTMATALDEQYADLGAVGPPPAEGRHGFRTAMRHLDEARGVAHRVARSLSHAAQSPPATLRKAFTAAGGLQVDGADYPGFLADLVDLLGHARSLVEAVEQAPSCADLGGS